MSGRHRGVGGKHRGSRDDFQGGFKIDVVFSHGLRQPLQAGKGGMPLIHMQDFRRNSHGAEGLHATNAQKDFLGQSYFGIPDIQTRRNFAMGGSVIGDIGIQQIERDTADHNFPDNGMKRSIRSADGNPQVVARLILHAFRRKIIKIGFRISLLLPAFGIEKLTKISVVIHQSDADQGKSQIGCGL